MNASRRHSILISKLHLPITTIAVATRREIGQASFEKSSDERFDW
jgi:hypothetical protein